MMIVVVTMVTFPSRSRPRFIARGSLGTYPGSNASSMSGSSRSRITNFSLGESLIIFLKVCFFIFFERKSFQQPPPFFFCFSSLSFARALKVTHSLSRIAFYFPVVSSLEVVAPPPPVLVDASSDAAAALCWVGRLPAPSAADNADLS